MDIDLLSKMIKEIILDSDEVTLPGVGTFVAEVVPSTFSDKGYTINPPYRRLSFRQREASDTCLVDFYARSNELDRAAATSILVRFLEELRETLISRKTIIFPELGRLRATRENNFFFVPDEDLSIYPEGFGLEPVSLKTHVETEDDLAVAIDSIHSILVEPATPEEVVDLELEPVLVPEPASAPVSASASEPVAPPMDEETVHGPAAASVPVPEPEKSAAPQVETTPAVEKHPASQEETAPAAEVRPAPVRGKLDFGPAPAVRSGRERPPMPGALKVLLCLMGTAAILLGIFILLAQVAPDFIDTLLYTEEELQIIHQRCLN